MNEDPSAERTSVTAADRIVSPSSSLFTRQAIFVTVMILLTGCGLTIAGYGFARQILTQQIGKRLNLAAVERRNGLLGFISRQNERARVLRDDSQLLNLLDWYADELITAEEFREQAGQILADVQTSLAPSSAFSGDGCGRCLAISLIDVQGKLVLRSGDPVVKGPFSETAEYQRGRKAFTLGRWIDNEDYSRIVLSIPVITNARRLYVAILEVEAVPLVALLRVSPNSLENSGAIFVGRVVDGRVQLFDPMQDRLLKTHTPEEVRFFGAALHGKTDAGTVAHWNGRRVIAASRPLGYEDWALAVKVDEDDAYEPMGRMRVLLFGLAAGTLLVGILLSYAFTFRITRPLRELVQFSSNVARGNFQQRCPIDSNDEIGILAESLNHMAEQLQQSYATLEQRVERRAAQLIKTNKKLTQEVQARRATEQALEQEQFLLHTLLETLPDNIYFKDRESRFMRIGRAMASRFGLADPADAIGKNDHDFFTEQHANQARRDEEALMLSGEPIIDLEEKETWADGRITWASTTKLPLRNDAGELVGTFGISRDITQRRQAQLALREAKEAADAANRAKSEFVANMSHEIRTPLNGIIGMTELALDTDLSSEQRDYLETVAQSAEALLLIVNDILDFSKIEAGKLELEMTEFQLHDTLDNTLHTLALRAHKKGLELAYYVSADVPNCLIGDPVRFRQIVTNLIGNAIKFTQQGEVVLNVRVEQFDSNQVTLHVQVTDTGIGIAADKQRSIFEAFTQADASTTRRFGGTGLGLTISAYLVQRMSGKIWVESDEGKGTSFFFTATFGWKDEPSPRELDDHRDRLRGVKILVVDDNQTNLRILHEMLGAWEMQPTAVSSAKEALATIVQAAHDGTPYEVCLTDYHMPEMDGFSLVQQIRAHQDVCATIVLMLTSGSMPEDAERASALGITAHLLKPVRQSRLLTCLEAALLGEAVDRSIQIAAEDTSRQLPPLHILVAEDGLVNQKLVRELLHKRGHRVTVVSNGQEAVDTSGTQQPDVVLMDVQMPLMDGIEATRQIRARELNTGRHVPIVAMTAHAMKGDRERCLQSGMDQYVSKPLRVDQLFEAIAAALGRAATRHVQETPTPLTTQQDNSPPTEPDGQPPASQQPPEMAAAPGAGAAPEETACDVDWHDALDAVNGDREILKSVVDAFLEESPQLLDRMRIAIESGDADALQRAAHTMKGSLRFFGVAHAAELAWQLETAGKTNALADAPNLFQQLETLARTLEPTLIRGPG